MIKNVLLISCDFPASYYQFAKAFKRNGCTVIVIGSTPYDQLHSELKSNINEYIHTYEMENQNKMFEIVSYLEGKYGHIDFLESNNEYWLRSDSIIREHFHISSGIYPHELDNFQKKSEMKKAFIASGMHPTPFIVSDKEDELKAFAKKYGYPLFAKPDIGVGAFGNYKINNEDDLMNFLHVKPSVDYIVEAFVEGRIVTFDGIADANSEVVIVANEIFPREIYNFLNTKADMFYYVNKELPEKLLEQGKKMIKAFGLKNRFFHTELFIAENSIPGHFKKGDIVPLEINIRTPGGFTPDLLNFGLSTNLYQMFADVICFGSSKEPFGPRCYAACASRRTGKKYFFNEEDILRTFKNQVCNYGDYPEVFSGLMGNRFYMAKFEKEEDVILFRDYVLRLADQPMQSHTSISHVVGEDKRMLDDAKNDNKDDLTICDKHIDGA